MRSIEWWYFQWPWRTSNPVFKVTAFLKSNIVKMARLKDKVTIAQEETISNIWNGTMFGDLDWPLNASRGFVSISWASCFYHAVAFCWEWRCIFVSIAKTGTVQMCMDYTNLANSAVTNRYRILLCAHGHTNIYTYRNMYCVYYKTGRQRNWAH